MSFGTQVNQQLEIDGVAYRVAEHPAAPGMPYGQEGRQAIVYQLSAGNERRALKAFKPRFRDPALVDLAARLRAFAPIPGLQVCDRIVLTRERTANLDADLLYAMLMPWVAGETWQGVMLSGQPFTRAASQNLAAQLATILGALEHAGIAHCDLSAPNLIVSSDSLQHSITLVDVEGLFAPGLAMPKILPAGSQGYAHKTAPQGLWSAEADRFAGAILLAEMLGWCDARVRQAAWGEQYFDPAEMQSNSERYQLLYVTLKSQDHQFAYLFARAWFSETLDACPSFGEWANGLEGKPVEEIMSQPMTLPTSDRDGNLQARLARARLEAGEVFFALDDVVRAVTEFEEAYRLYPSLAAQSYARALLARGTTNEQTQDWNAALADYQHALQVALEDSALKKELESIVRKMQLRQTAPSPLVKSQSQCPHCDNQVQVKWVSCPYCGTLLRDSVAPKSTMVETRPGQTNPISFLKKFFSELDWIFFLKWTLANVLGWGIGFPLAITASVILAVGTFESFESYDISAFLGIATCGLVMSLAVALAQRSIYFKHLVLKRWLIVNIIGGMTGWLLVGESDVLYGRYSFIKAFNRIGKPGLYVSDFILPYMMKSSEAQWFIAGGVLGLCLGISHWVFLRRKSNQAWIWIIVNSIALGFSFVFFRVSSLLNTNNWINATFAAVFIGLCFGLFTGIVLLFLNANKLFLDKGNDAKESNKRDARDFHLWWLVSSCAGIFAGFGFMVLAVFLSIGFGYFDPDYFFFKLLFSMGSTFIGLSQWLFPCRQFKINKLWIVSYPIGFLVGSVCGNFLYDFGHLPEILGNSVVIVVGGGVVGIIQSLILRLSRWHIALWCLTVIFAGGLVPALITLDVQGNYSNGGLLGFFIGGILGWTIMGLHLQRIIEQRQKLALPTLM